MSCWSSMTNAKGATVFTSPGSGPVRVSCGIPLSSVIVILARLEDPSGIRLNVAAVTANNALDGREPDPGALEFLIRVQALEHAEELLGIRHVEAGAVVAHEIGAAPVAGNGADLDSRVGALAGIFP